MSNTYKNASSLTGAIANKLDNLLNSSDNSLKEKIVLEKLNNLFRLSKDKIHGISFDCEFLVDWLNEAKHGKTLIKRHEALFNSIEIALRMQNELINLELKLKESLND